MKHYEVINLYNKLNKVKGLKGYEITYARTRNLKYLKTEMDIYSEGEKDVLLIAKDFNDDLAKLKAEYAHLANERGFLELKGDDAESFQKKHDELVEKHKDEYEKMNSEWVKLVEFRKTTESDFKPFMCKKEYCPKDISDENMDLIFDILED